MEMSWAVAGTATLVFVARVVDVALGTLRIALVSRGVKRAAPLVGFFEILVWLTAFTQVVRNLDQPLHYLAFAGGYATGTWLGLVLEERLALGLYAVRIITKEDAEDLIETLGEHHFGMTTFAARGLRGQVRLILTIIRRRDLGKVQDAVREKHPGAFVSVSDVRLVSEGYLLQSAPAHRRLLGWLQKK